MINFFCSGEHAEAWLQTQAPQPDGGLAGTILTLEEAVELGHDLWGKLREETER